jgi:type III secretion system-like peptide-binding chaperone
VTRIEVLRPFVVEAVAAYLGIDEDQLQTWDDGTIPIRAGSAVVNVRLVEGGGGHPILQVFAPVLHDVQASPGLFEKLNEMNTGLMFARGFFIDGQVIISAELRAESLDAEQIAQAVSVLSLAADLWDGTLKQEFGGETAFPQEPAQQAAAASGGGAAPSDPMSATRSPADPSGTPPPPVTKTDDPPPAGYI